MKKTILSFIRFVSNGFNIWKKPVRNPSQGDKYASQGIKAYHADDFYAAVENIEHALIIGIKRYDSAELYTIIGNAYSQLGISRKAIAAHESALQINPNYALA